MRCLGFVEVRKATRVSLIPAKSLKRENTITKYKTNTKKYKVRSFGFPAVTVHVFTSATSFPAEKITVYSRNVHTLPNTAV